MTATELTRDQVVAVLLESARKAGAATTSVHPIDIEGEMTVAMEYAAGTLTTMKDLDLVEWRWFQ